MSEVGESFPDIPVIDVAADISDEEIIRQVESKLDSQVLDAGYAEFMPQVLADYVKQRGEFSMDYFNKREVPFWWKMFLLVARNNGWEVRGWGYMSSGCLFGYGLEQDDALLLIQWSHFLDGCSLLGPAGWNAKDALFPIFSEWVGIHKGIKKAQEAAGEVVSG